MSFNFLNDSSFLEPLKDDEVSQTPRYKQVNSPRIFFQNGSVLRGQLSSSNQSLNTSTQSSPRRNGQMSEANFIPRHSGHSSIRSSGSNILYTSSRPLLRHNSSLRSEKLVGTNHWRPSTFEAIRNECLEKGQLYEDPVFPAADSSLYLNTSINVKNIKWKRPYEITTSPKFIVNDVSDMDIEPGKLGDCLLVSAFTCLSIVPTLLQKCVPSDQDFRNKYAGIFHFRFWRYGEWIDVIVDDRLPTVDGHILYMRSSDPEEFWPALFEKAYAKLYGSYENILGGRILWALQDITGGITNAHSVSESSRHLLTVIDLAMSRASLIGAYISTTITGDKQGVLNNGLKTGLTYSITGYSEIPVTGGKIVLLRLRNPWHHIFWKGAWNPHSPHWKVLDQSTREKMQVDSMADGEFWISFVDFKNVFTEIEICHLSPESWKCEPNIQHRGIWTAAVAHRQWRKGFNSGGCVNPSVMCNNSQFYVELDKRTTVVVSLMQKYKNTDDQRRFQICSCLIYKVQKGLISKLDATFFVKHNVYASTKFIQARENVHTFVLSEGAYLILPVTEIEGQEGRYMLRFYTAGNSIIRELDDEDKMEEPDNEHMNNGRIHLLRKQFKTSTTQSKYEEIDAKGLQKILSTSSKEPSTFLCCSMGLETITFKPLNLCVETCKAAITIFDTKVNGRLGYSDFNKLMSKLITWQNVFHKFAKKNSDFASYCLRNALRLTGFHVSNKTLETLVVRFTDDGRVSLDEFICMIIKLYTAHYRYQQSFNGQASLLTELLHTAIYS